MKTKTVNMVWTLAVCLLVAGCSTTAPKSGKYSEVPEADKLERDTRFPHSLVYIKEGVKLSLYTKFMVDPVEIYRGSDASWHKQKVTEQEKQELAQFARAELIRALGKSYAVVNQPGPGVMRIKMTLVDVELTTTSLAVVSHLAPAGVGINLLKTGAGMQGSFMGSVTLAGELRDSLSDAVIAAYLTKQTPLALDVSKTFGKLSAARAGLTEGAEKFKAAVDRVQTGTVAP
jgi:Protein of unknown function (DUF3313)